MIQRLRDIFSLGRFRQRLAEVDALPQLSLLALVSGLVTGLVMVLFRLILEAPLTWLSPGGAAQRFEFLGWETRVLLPLVGGLVIGIVFQRLRAVRRGVGVTHVMERLARHQGHLPAPNAVVQFLGGIAALATGQSAGREGPAIHLGAAASSILGQRMRLPNNSIRTLVGCRTAAAIASSFNTPLAGVIFAMEVVMMEYTVASFIPMIVAAVSATLVSVLVYGDAPAFAVPQVEMSSLRDMPWVVLAAIVIGVVAAGFMRIVDFFAAFNQYPIWMRFTAAGGITGAVALVAPEVMGVGYDSVENALTGEYGLWLLLSIAALKLLTSAATAGLGLPAGVIGPTLVIGAMAGGAMGALGAMIWPAAASTPGFYGILGMGAMMGAVLQAPLAALLALLELTLNPNIILPAMLTIVVASLTASQVFGRPSVFVTLLAARGLKFASDPITQALQRAGVGSLMERRFARSKRHITESEARSLLERQPQWIVVDDADGPVCVLAAADLVRHLEHGATEAGDRKGAAPRKKAEPETEVPEEIVDLVAIPGLRKDVTLLQVQATLHEALAALDGTGKEAVCVTRTAAPMITPIVGILTRGDIEKFYGLKG
ncbi:MAG: chloride channel protein [Pseudomonadales bacterium]|jgi:CIC family chloride channel protein|nr:chloride channel protein [Pseudomonadales bacterium]